jgi:hypothetical protein
MMYDTNNIDEAAYLALQGYHFTVTRTGSISALFSFEKDEHFDDVRARFWKGEVTVQLHRWLATRNALKNECAGQALSLKRVSSPPLVPAERETVAAVRTGQAYWYYDGDTIKGAMFGSRLLHASRLADGNFYLTREDAKLKRNAVQVA